MPGGTRARTCPRRPFTDVRWFPFSLYSVVIRSPRKYGCEGLKWLRFNSKAIPRARGELWLWRKIISLERPPCLPKGVGFSLADRCTEARVLTKHNSVIMLNIDTYKCCKVLKRKYFPNVFLDSMFSFICNDFWRELEILKKILMPRSHNWLQNFYT